MKREEKKEGDVIVRRMLLVLGVALIMAATLAFMLAPAFAAGISGGQGIQTCREFEVKENHNTQQ